MYSADEPEGKPQRPPLRRILVLLIPGLLSLSVAVLILVWEAYNPPGWQRAMESYLAGHVSAPRETLGTARASVAQSSFYFSPDTPFRPVSSSVHYSTGPLSTEVPPDSPESLGKQPLPWPVLELYCIDFTRSSAALPAARFLVADHRDLYNSDWIVYAPAEEAPRESVDAAWQELGCNTE